MRFKTTATLVVAMVAALSSLTASAQFAIKTNLLYDATTTPNLGVEVAVGRHHTLNLVYGINPWTFHSDTHGDRKATHWVAQPEYRWWPCAAFNGHFFGVHALGGQFNVANVNIPVPGFFFSGENLSKGARDFRYQGWYLGGGLTYGYQWILSRHSNIEAEIGIGYIHARYDKYPCTNCGTLLDNSNTNYVGLTKLGLSYEYIF
ncbi:MAG: DUF3575 domain-containing protein [Muribaculaceae bacterium]|nr:DUF3575 domain-containing protein [Muribaculaceae bacterium]